MTTRRLAGALALAALALIVAADGNALYAMTFRGEDVYRVELGTATARLLEIAAAAAVIGSIAATRAAALTGAVLFGMLLALLVSKAEDTGRVLAAGWLLWAATAAAGALAVI
ncbi:MAG TPA: hypothetical protein VFZ89_07640, partial [Solirubrobacteraceae bacterium]